MVYKNYNVTPIDQLSSQAMIGGFGSADRMGGGYPPNLPSNSQLYAGRPETSQYPWQANGTSQIHGSGAIIQERYELEPDPLSCLDIHYHIEECPICMKKFDNTVYIFTNIILFLIVLFLAKKVIRS